VFSAYGIGTCDISQRYTELLIRHDQSGLEDALAVLNAKAARDMYAEGFDKGNYEVEARLVAVDAKGVETSQSLAATPVFPAGMAGAATVELELAAIKRLRAGTGATARVNVGAAATAVGVRNILARGRGRIDVPVYQLAGLKPGDHAAGPAIVEEDYFTCRVLEGWTFVISDAGDILLNRKA
jgi:N-methylhydantoinase A/oxoprolinase/acetone carboxylase beta subunit